MPGIRTATPRTLARWTLDSIQHGVATAPEYRGGVQHEAALLNDAELGARWMDAVQQGRDVTLQVADRPDLVEDLLTEDFQPLLTEAGDPLTTTFGPYDGLRLAVVSGLPVTVEVVTSVTFDDGTTAEHSTTQILTVTGRERLPGSIALTLTDIEDTRLNTRYPLRTYNADDFPDLLTSDAGRAVPNVAGIALKLPCVLVENPVGGPYRYAVNEGTVTVLTVYRGKGQGGDRVVDPFEYTVGTSSTPFDYTYVEFTSEQRDFDGSLFTLTADVEEASVGVNPVTYLRTLLDAAGVTTDGTTFAAHEGHGGNLMVDVDAGRDGQRLIRAMVEDLLWIIGGTLSRDSTGAYALTVDTAASSAFTLDEDAGDLVALESLSEPTPLASLGIAYRPSPRNPEALQHELRRSVSSNGVGDERNRPARYVRRHETADRINAYRTALASDPRRLRGRIYLQDVALGDIGTFSSRALGLTASEWRIRDLRHIPGGVAFEATPYSSALTSYTAATLPADATDDYQPDYSATPPAAPTALTITAGSTALANDGALTARITASCTVPAANYAEVWLTAIHNVTSEIAALVRATVAGTTATATLSALRPGEVYQLKAYAVNAFAVQGVVQGTFNATAIGGASSTTTFTAPGYATLPPNVASISAAQGSAKLIEANWSAVTVSNLAAYVLERRIGAGAYSEVWRGKGRQYVDRAVSYGNTYTYRVKALDSYGNLSAAYATSSGVTLTTGTISGGSSSNDINTNTVATTNRTGISTVSAGYTTPSLESPVLLTIAHSLGKIPVVTQADAGKSGAWGALVGTSTTDLDVLLYGAPSSHGHTLATASATPTINGTAVTVDNHLGGSTSSELAANPHAHTIPAHGHTSPSHTHTQASHTHALSGSVTHSYFPGGSTASFDVW